VSHTLLEDLREIFRAGDERQREAGNYMARADSVTFDGFEIDSKGFVHINAAVPVCDFEMGCGSSGVPAWSYYIAFRATGKLDRTFKIVFEIDEVWAKNDRIWFHYPATRPALSDDVVGARIRQVIENRPVLFALSPDTFFFRTPRASRELAGLMEEMGGWPSPDTAEFVVRMFHLSATTITTTGYGDIVPLTSAARILTGSEALVGTVLLGLFIYSLPINRRR
jgi:Ion channel